MGRRPSFNPKPGPRRELSEREIREIFERHDANKDGCLSKAEIKQAFDELGALFPGFRANRGLNHADGNGDGFIDMNELKDLVKYAKNLGYTV
ncbi:hypothetical protein ACOSP7_010732 [Xanthoceras sorbifolium]